MKRAKFVSAVSFAGAASLAAAGTSRAAALAGDIPGGRDFVETSTSFDAAAFAALLGRKADIRQVFENIAMKPTVFNNIKNSLNGLQFGFGVPNERIAIAVVNHGPSSAYNYTDEVWQKYDIGTYFDAKDKSGATLTGNVFWPAKNPAASSTDPNDEHGSLQDSGMATLQARGVVFITCHTAVEEQARGLVAAGHAPAGMTASDVADDILTHLIPGAVVVPSAVATIAVLQQRFGYSYVTIQS
jgi:intracellular sulfur oxidation DsrE/DsrF family protein